jgi:NUMOD4 motif/HNH endonuclease
MWKSVLGFEGYYEISENGIIKSLEKEVNNSKTTKRIVKERIRKPFITKKGYVQIMLSKHKINYKFYVHRLVAINFVDNPYNKLEVNHIDGNKQNNHFLNLEWCTRAENNKHAFDIGLKENKKGSDSKISKLTKEQREEIKKSSLSRKKLRIMYNVGQTTIQRIKTDS